MTGRFPGNSTPAPSASGPCTAASRAFLSYVRPSRRRCWPRTGGASRTWCGAAALLPVRHLRRPQAPEYVPDGFTGVDLGIVNIATTSDGTVHSGKHINQVRHRNRRLRTKLQAKGTKSAKRLLRHLSGREARFAADTNHRISKSIVTEAQRTTHGIALEDLGGIRARVRLRKPQRVTLHTWSFAQLGAFITYKAQRVGVPVIFVAPVTPRKGARRAATSTRTTGSTRPLSHARCAASLSTPTSTQPATSPHRRRGLGVSHAADDAA